MISYENLEHFGINFANFFNSCESSHSETYAETEPEEEKL